MPSLTLRVDMPALLLRVGIVDSCAAAIVEPQMKRASQQAGNVRDIVFPP
jgi:hypothetical protein